MGSILQFMISNFWPQAGEFINILLFFLS